MNLIDSSAWPEYFGAGPLCFTRAWSRTSVRYFAKREIGLSGTQDNQRGVLECSAHAGA